MVESGEDSVKSFILNEDFLNNFLQCPVCLEKLDSSSKVLPCQHTFCRRCLQEILNIHEELRCPECRKLVDAEIEELPCNILFIRLLEGIKNNVQRINQQGEIIINVDSEESKDSSSSEEESENEDDVSIESYTPGAHSPPPVPPPSPTAPSSDIPSPPPPSPTASFSDIPPPNPPSSPAPPRDDEPGDITPPPRGHSPCRLSPPPLVIRRRGVIPSGSVTTQNQREESLRDEIKEQQRIDMNTTSNLVEPQGRLEDKNRAKVTMKIKIFYRNAKSSLKKIIHAVEPTRKDIHLFNDEQSALSNLLSNDSDSDVSV